MRSGRHFPTEEWNGLDLEAQRARLREVPIEQRLEEVLAWSAALLADEIERVGEVPRMERPVPVGLGNLLR